MECRKDKIVKAWKDLSLYTKPLKMFICFALNQFCISKLHRRASLYENKIQISFPPPPHRLTSFYFWFFLEPNTFISDTISHISVI